MVKQLSILQRLVLQRERFYSLRAWRYLNRRFFSKQFCVESDEIQSNEEIILAGYSEGGYVTMAAHMMIE